MQKGEKLDMGIKIAEWKWEKMWNGNAEK